MPVLETEFEVFCSCGEGLCLQTIVRTSRGRRIPQVVVPICKKCAEYERRTGFREGFEAGENHHKKYHQN